MSGGELSMNHTAAFEELKVSGKLPSPSGVALELMRLMQKDGVTIQELAKWVQMDPALTGRLLQLANSPAVGARRPVAAVVDAVALLGMNTVRQFALCVSVVNANRTGACEAFDYNGFWVGSLARALAAQAVSARQRCVAPEEAFTCALLSEIGRLALATVYPSDYDECLRAGQEGNDEELIERERERFSIDHRQVTLGLLKDWGFPLVLLEAVASHHTQDHKTSTEHSRGDLFAAQLCLAARLGQFCTLEPRARDALLPQIIPMAAGLGLSKAELDELWSQLAQQWQSWRGLLCIEADDMPPLGPASVAQKETGEARAPAEGLGILLVDDDLLQVTRLAKKLRADGHTVFIARNGDDGLKIALQEEPKLVITDWRMTPMDGMQFCRALRALEFGRHIYVIMLTAAENDEVLVQAFAAGADDFIVKPVQDRVLAARVHGGQRIIRLQEELAREQAEIRRYASELAIANRRLEVLAMTDNLTDIPNRRYAFARLEEEWAVWRRTGRPLSVMVLDLDHFKSINDTLGHPVGDQILAHAAKVIQTTLRASDVVCRLGGEEFIVIAANTDRAAAQLLGERLRSAVEQHQLGSVGLTTPLTVSVGVAVSSARIANGSDLLHQADQALYLAKHGGRNRVRIHS
jgi:two-component system cell cycle response regulator